MTGKNLEEVKKTAFKILSLVGFDARIEAKETENQISLEIEAQPTALLIGKQGQNLTALERILQVIFYQKLSGKIISTDAAGFRKKRIENLTQAAKAAIEEVLATKTPKTLEGLTASERKLVHLEVAKNSKVVSESQGEGVDRILIVKPANFEK